MIFILALKVHIIIFGVNVGYRIRWLNRRRKVQLTQGFLFFLFTLSIFSFSSFSWSFFFCSNASFTSTPDKKNGGYFFLGFLAVFLLATGRGQSAKEVDGVRSIDSEWGFIGWGCWSAEESFAVGGIAGSKSSGGDSGPGSRQLTIGCFWQFALPAVWRVDTFRQALENIFRISITVAQKPGLAIGSL